MRLADRLGENEAVLGAIKIENLGVAAPVHGRIKLALHFVFTEMLVENVIEKFLRNRMIGLGMQNAVDLLQDHHVLQRRLAEEHLAAKNIGFRKMSAFGSDLNVAFFQCRKAEQDGGLDDRKKVLGIHDEVFGEAVEIFLPPRSCSSSSRPAMPPTRACGSI